MDCSEARRLTPLSMDGELDTQDEAALAAHGESCEACRVFRQQQEAARGAIRSGATYHRASAALRRRIVTALPAPRKPFGWRFLAGAGAIATACAALLLTVFLTLQFSADDGRVDELVAGHARALLTKHLIDIASADQHTVKPWFNGKVDFSPPVRDLADHGFPLVGGRLDYLDRRLVAVVVYQRRQHLIDVFVWPTDDRDNAQPTSRTSQGYHVIGKTAGGMSFRAVSDLDDDELRQLVDLL